MHIRFNDLVNTVVDGRLAGKSFLEISRDCAIPDPDFIQLVYTWKVHQEPITWKRQHLDLELARLETIHSAYWLDAISGDRRAASILLKANNSKMALIEKVADFPEDKTDELSEMLIESAEEAEKVEVMLRSQIDKYNELIKDIDIPRD
jgi:hypothetical protein